MKAQLTIRDLFWLVLVLNPGFNSLAEETDEIPTMTAQEFFKEFRNPSKGLGGLTCYRFLRTDEGFDYFDFVEFDKPKKEFKVKTGFLKVGKSPEHPRRIAVISFPEKWWKTGKTDP
jgi:hypothetical protein